MPTATASKVRYFFDRDNDAHWYLVPESCRIDWESWLDDDNPEDEDPPEGAIMLGTGVNLVTFTDPDCLHEK